MVYVSACLIIEGAREGLGLGFWETSLIWDLFQEKAILSDSGNLTLEGVSYLSAGSYVCEARAPAIRGLKRSQSIEVYVQ
ncbi:hypothetical protein chiPu_0031700, partial [Chiloscyllium punctatum]|nr:hypothetical protein [Chiloscyllium punctatum]